MIDIYLNQSGVITRQAATYNGDGEDQASSPVSVACRVQHTTKRVRGASGELVVSTAQVFLRPGQSIEVGDYFTHQGQRRQVLEVKQAQGFDDVAFVLASLGG